MKKMNGHSVHVGASSFKVLVQYEARATLIRGGYVFFCQSESYLRPIGSLVHLSALN